MAEGGEVGVAGSNERWGLWRVGGGVEGGVDRE